LCASPCASRSRRDSHQHHLQLARSPDRAVESGRSNGNDPSRRARIGRMQIHHARHGIREDEDEDQDGREKSRKQRSLFLEGRVVPEERVGESWSGSWKTASSDWLSTGTSEGLTGDAMAHGSLVLEGKSLHVGVPGWDGVGGMKVMEWAYSVGVRSCGRVVGSEHERSDFFWMRTPVLILSMRPRPPIIHDPSYITPAIVRRLSS
ncbi:hypothetical protein BJ875DRAFT_518331, partial [Amylocarpus encephaloides]